MPLAVSALCFLVKDKKPAPFEYQTSATLQDAVSLLAANGFYRDERRCRCGIW
jgi:hypothetical protein